MEEKIKKGFMEISSHLPEGRLNVPKQQLMDAAEKSQIHTFGWPIGVVLQRPEYSPKPTKDGIKAVLDIDRHTTTGGGSFDYWHLKQNGDYYILTSLFEDMRTENKIFLDTRTVRITEAFLHIALLYKHLGVPDDQEVAIKIKHGGLKARILAVANPMRIMGDERTCHEDEVESDFMERLGDIQPKLKDLVFKTVSELSEMFELFVPSKDQVIDPIVDNFKAGRIT